MNRSACSAGFGVAWSPCVCGLKITDFPTARLTSSQENEFRHLRFSQKAILTIGSRFRRRVVVCVQDCVSGVRTFRRVRISQRLGRHGLDFRLPTRSPILWPCVYFAIARVSTVLSSYQLWNPRQIWGYIGYLWTFRTFVCRVTVYFGLSRKSFGQAHRVRRYYGAEIFAHTSRR